MVLATISVFEPFFLFQIVIEHVQEELPREHDVNYSAPINRVSEISLPSFQLMREQIREPGARMRANLGSLPVVLPR
jgi:hypothetical protein